MPGELPNKADAFIDNMSVASIWIPRFAIKNQMGFRGIDEGACSDRSCPRQVRDAYAEAQASGPTKS